MTWHYHSVHLFLIQLSNTSSKELKTVANLESQRMLIILEKKNNKARNNLVS
jgi:hypothetical protein